METPFWREHAPLTGGSSFDFVNFSVVPTFSLFFLLNPCIFLDLGLVRHHDFQSNDIPRRWCYP